MNTPTQPFSAETIDKSFYIVGKGTKTYNGKKRTYLLIDPSINKYERVYNTSNVSESFNTSRGLSSNTTSKEVESSNITYEIICSPKTTLSDFNRTDKVILKFTQRGFNIFNNRRSIEEGIDLKVIPDVNNEINTEKPYIPSSNISRFVSKIEDKDISTVLSKANLTGPEPQLGNYNYRFSVFRNNTAKFKADPVILEISDDQINNSDHFLQIGHVSLSIPPNTIRVIEQNNARLIENLRSETSIKELDRSTRKTISFGFIISGKDDINNKLIPIMDMIKRTPFLPILNDLINNQFDIDAIVINNIAVKTVTNAPNKLEVSITADAFNWEYYLPEAYTFIDSFNWPLFKLWCYTRSTARPVGGQFDGSFLMKVPLSDVEQLSSQQLNLSKEYQSVLNNLGVSKRDSLALIDAQTFLSPTFKDLRSLLLKDIEQRQTKSVYEDWHIDRKMEAGAPVVYVQLRDPETKQYLLTLANTNLQFMKNSGGANQGYPIQGYIRYTESELKTLREQLYDLTNNQLTINTTEIWVKFDESTSAVLSSILQKAKTSEVLIRDIQSESMSTLVLSNDTVITDIFTSLSPKTSYIPIDQEDIGIHQYISGGDNVVSVTFLTKNKEDLKSIQTLCDATRSLGREYRLRPNTKEYKGYIAIDNEVLNALGVYAILPLNLDIQTVPKFPDLFSITLQGIEYKESQAAQERFKSMEVGIIDWVKNMRNAFLTEKEVVVPSDGGGRRNQPPPPRKIKVIDENALRSSPYASDYNLIQKIYKDKNQPNALADSVLAIIDSMFGDKADLLSNPLNNNIYSTYQDVIFKENLIASKLRASEVYPDMKLPTYWELAFWIDLIKYYIVNGSVENPSNQLLIEVAMSGIDPTKDNLENLLSMSIPYLPTGQPDYGGFADPDFYCTPSISESDSFQELITNVLNNTDVLYVDHNNFKLLKKPGAIFNDEDSNQSPELSNAFALYKKYMDSDGAAYRPGDDNRVSNYIYNGVTLEVVDRKLSNGNYLIKPTPRYPQGYVITPAGYPQLVDYLGNKKNRSTHWEFGKNHVSSQDLSSVDEFIQIVNPPSKGWGFPYTGDPIDNTYITPPKVYYDPTTDSGLGLTRKELAEEKKLQLKQMSNTLRRNRFNTPESTIISNAIRAYGYSIFVNQDVPSVGAGIRMHKGTLDSMSSMKQLVEKILFGLQPYFQNSRIVTPELVMAVIVQESDNRDLPPNSDQATGRMQVTVPTARDTYRVNKKLIDSISNSIGLDLRVWLDIPSALRNKTANIILGTIYLLEGTRATGNIVDSLGRYYGIVDPAYVSSVLEMAGYLEGTKISVATDNSPFNPLSPSVSIKPTRSIPENNNLAIDKFFVDHKSKNLNRLIRAFPCYYVSVIDGGRWIGKECTWDRLYEQFGILSIDVVSQVGNAVDVATVMFSNLYSRLTGISYEIALQKQNDVRTKSLFNTSLVDYMSLVVNDISKTFIAYSTEELESRRKAFLNSIMLKPGARLHIRMGYGADASKLPVLFNGVIAEVPVYENTVEVVALGDGIELVKDFMSDEITDSPEGPLYQPQYSLGKVVEPRDAIVDILKPSFTAVEDWLIRTNIERLLSQVYPENKHGITHFGSYFRNNSGVPLYQNILGVRNSPQVPNEQMQDLWFSMGELDVNIYNSSDDPNNSTAIEQRWGTLTGGAATLLNNQVFVNIRSQETTPWGVIRQLRLAIPDFACAVRPFSFRSTLFFGKPNYAFFYDYKAIDKPDFLRRYQRPKTDPLAYTHNVLQDDTSDTTRILPESFSLPKEDSLPGAPTNSSNVFTDNMEYKAFSQVHVIMSGHNLIRSNITATSSNMITAAQAKYFNNNNSVSTKIQYADTDIFSEHQKILTFDSGFETNFLTAESFFEGLVFNGSMIAANNAAVMKVRDGISNMYEGHNLIVGDPFINTWDYIYLNDTYNLMHGVYQVSEVIHSFNGITGFTSAVKPMALVACAGTSQHSLWAAIASIGKSYVTQKALIAVGSKMYKGYSRHKLLAFKTSILSMEKKLRASGRIKEADDLIKYTKYIINPSAIKTDIRSYTAGFLRTLRKDYRGLYKTARIIRGDAIILKNAVKTSMTIDETLFNLWVNHTLSLKAGKADKVFSYLINLNSSIASKGIHGYVNNLKGLFVRGASGPGKSIGTFVGKNAFKLFGLASKAIFLLVTFGIGDQIGRTLSSRQVVVISPLMIGDKEFSAGINGHLGSVIGDIPSNSDQWLAALFNSGVSYERHGLMTAAVPFLLGFILPGADSNFNPYVTDTDLLPEPYTTINGKKIEQPNIVALEKQLYHKYNGTFDSPPKPAAITLPTPNEKESGISKNHLPKIDKISLSRRLEKYTTDNPPIHIYNIYIGITKVIENLGIRNISLDITSDLSIILITHINGEPLNYNLPSASTRSAVETNRLANILINRMEVDDSIYGSKYRILWGTQSSKSISIGKKE